MLRYSFGVFEKVQGRINQMRREYWDGERTLYLTVRLFINIGRMANLFNQDKRDFSQRLFEQFLYPKESRASKNVNTIFYKGIISNC